MSERGITCPECNGAGGFTVLEPACCGNVYPNGECRAHCAVPVPAKEPCEFCGGCGEVENPDPCTQRARDLGCSCRMSQTHSASIDPPHEIIDRECPLHGSPRDPDYERDLRIEDAELFADEPWDEP